MFDWAQLRDLMWEGRWDGIVLLWQALVTNVVTHWWFGPLLALMCITASRRAWWRLFKYVGSVFVRTHGNG